MEEMKTLRQAKREGTLTADQQERIKSLRQQQRAKHDTVRQQVLAVLTPEQLQQIETNKAEWQKRREERKLQRQQKLQNQQLPESKDN